MFNLHNLQMLFMLRIKYKFSECLSLLHQQRRPLMEDFLATALPRPADTGHSGEVIPKSFLCPDNFCCAQKNFFRTYDEKKFFSP